MNDASNHHIFKINEVCNYDPEIIPYLHMPIGTCLIRVEEGKFVIDDDSQPIHMEKQDNR